MDKIESKHGVFFSEVEEAIPSSLRHVRRGRAGLYKLFSQTEAGRYLLVVLAEKADGVWWVVTAREMTVNERALYRRQMGD